MPMSSANRPSKAAAISVGSRMIRPAASQAGADRDRDRKDGVAGGDDLLGAPEDVLDQGLHDGRHHGASEPEPAGHEGAPPDPLVVAQMADERRRRGGNVAAD